MKTFKAIFSILGPLLLAIGMLIYAIGAESGSAMNDVIGSVGWLALAMIGLHLMKDPQRDD